MKLAGLRLEGGGFIAVNPEHVSHLEPRIGANTTLMFLNNDNIPTVLDDSYLNVISILDEAAEDEATLQLSKVRTEFEYHANALIRQIRNLQWAFGCSALAFLILLLVIVGRAH